MDHQSAKELFSEYLDGELSPEQAKELEAHLSECESCGKELEGLRKTLHSLAGLAPVPPPQDFGRKVQQRIRRRSRGRFFDEETSWLMRIPWEWISFVIIMLMLVVYFYLLQAQKIQVKAADGGQRTSQVDGGAKGGAGEGDATSSR